MPTSFDNQLAISDAASGDAMELRLVAAEKAIAEAVDLEQVKTVRSQAETLRSHVKKMAGSLRLQNHVAAIKVRAERRAGQLLIDLAARGERSGGAHGGDRRSSCTTTLGTLGISRWESARWQRIARIPDAAFEAEIRTRIDSKKELTTAGLLRFADRLASLQRRSALAAEEGPTQSVERLTSIGTFRTIYADPPWEFRNGGTRGAAKGHYPCMSVQQIAKLSVPQIADDPCQLHLWAPLALLPDALRVMAAWGFEYRTAFVWVKGSVRSNAVVPQLGLGNYWRTASELLLFGTRGKNATFLSNDIANWTLEPSKRHSAKPDAIRSLIERVSPGPRIELFARGKPAPGWTAWGNEVESI